MAKKAMENQEMEQKQAQEETSQPAQKTDQELAEERHYLFDAPISELAEYAGVSVDEAAKLRVMEMVKATPPKMEITVRPVEPQGNLYGFARITVGGKRFQDRRKQRRRVVRRDAEQAGRQRRLPQHGLCG